jgi:hypothetical protein
MGSTHLLNDVVMRQMVPSVVGGVIGAEAGSGWADGRSDTPYFRPT